MTSKAGERLKIVLMKFVAHNMEKFLVGEFTLHRKADKLYLLHRNMRKPAPLDERRLVLFLKRVMREAVGL